MNLQWLFIRLQGLGHLTHEEGPATTAALILQTKKAVRVSSDGPKLSAIAAYSAAKVAR